MTTIDEIYQEFVTEMKATIVEYRAKLKAAPMKRGWNRTFGISIPSKYDAVKEYNETMKGLQEFCESRGYEGIIEPKPEEVPVTRVNREQS